MKRFKRAISWIIPTILITLALPGTLVLAAAPPGTLSDPLVTTKFVMSYLTERFSSTNNQLNEIDSRLNLIQERYDKVMTDMGPYPDIIGHWAQKEVGFLAEQKVVSGFSDGNFYPNNKVTRAQLAVMLVRAKGLPLRDGNAGFGDVSSGYWAAKEITAAKKAGIISGYADNTFLPEKQVSRQEIAAMIARAFEFKAATGKVRFEDIDQVWGKKQIQQLADSGVIGGYQEGIFKPLNTASRAEIAAIIGRALDPGKRLKV